MFTQIETTRERWSMYKTEKPLRATDSKQNWEQLIQNKIESNLETCTKTETALI
jgi:hypothetical protein